MIEVHFCLYNETGTTIDLADPESTVPPDDQLILLESNGDRFVNIDLPENSRADLFDVKISTTISNTVIQFITTHLNQSDITFCHSVISVGEGKDAGTKVLTAQLAVKLADVEEEILFRYPFHIALCLNKSYGVVLMAPDNFFDLFPNTEQANLREDLSCLDIRDFGKYKINTQPSPPAPT